VRKVINSMPGPSESLLNPATLSKILAMKSDKQDIDRILGLKADKRQCENMIDWIKTLNKQVQHTVVLLQENFKINLVKAQETEQAKQEKAN
jgi:hypothetical protein